MSRAIAAEPLALPARTRAAAEPVGDSLPLRLACFMALAAYGAAHWAGLVVDAPVRADLPAARCRGRRRRGARAAAAHRAARIARCSRSRRS